MIQAILTIIKPLALSTNVQINYKVDDNLPGMFLQLTSVLQALINILTTAIHCVPGGQISIHLIPNYWNLRILIEASGIIKAHALSDDVIDALKLTRQLVGMSGASFDILTQDSQKQRIVFQLVLPGKEQVPVLVIDDNPDTLRLIERYLSNTRYQFIGSVDPEKALQLVEETPVQIIILDVMLPGIDGWEFLGRLRVHPKTNNVPIIVCTILPQEQLAKTLGSAAFIHKPIDRQTLISILDQQIITL